MTDISTLNDGILIGLALFTGFLVGSTLTCWILWRRLKRLGDERTKAVRQARIIALADCVFGDPAKAQHWLTKSHTRFNGLSPMRMAENDTGAKRVEEILWQLMEGLFP
jgi:uncharacterized protein (DUF2384 family)